MRYPLLPFLLLISILSTPPCWANQSDSVKLLIKNRQDNAMALLSIMDYYKLENPDSLNGYYQLLQQLKLSESQAIEAELIRIESLFKFNQYDSAYSLINNLRVHKSELAQHVKTLVLYGKILVKLNKLDQALTKLYEALDIAVQNNLENYYAEINTEIGFVLSENNDLENSKKYLLEALRLARNSGEVELQVEICYQLCRIYNGGIIVDLDSSIHYGLMGLEIARASAYEYGYADIMFILSAPLIRNGEYRKGLNMSREALALADKYNFPIKRRYYLILNQGFAYEKLGLYDSAILLKNQGASLRPDGLDHHRLSYLIHKAQGKYQEAMKDLEVYWPMKESLIKTKSQNQLSSLQARLDADIKERELTELSQKAQLQELQLAKQRYFLVGLFFVVLTSLVGFYLIYRQRQLKQRQALTNMELEETKKRLAVEQQFRDSELKALRSQMNPHFVFNALNSIQEYIMLNEKRLAGKYLGKFADLMRTYLHHSQQKAVTVQEEVEALELYLELEKLRFEDTLTYTIHLSSEVDAERMSLPALIVQPYVENAIKHGLLHKSGARQLDILFEVDENDLLCTIKDNGVGRKVSEDINKNRSPNHTSYATGAIQERITLINYSLVRPLQVKIIDVESKDGSSEGTRVVLRVPIESMVHSVV
ncbi:MAG: hypothetical protein CMB80_11415 [Flammeovirgaceae bacterium]|nr:hypothetical protein [Flammeovirgaceae bacterium]MBE60981.1 hypothetical protein [Flammeovirgaceae bacterium]MBR07251.1 hypothetical protein [Rickettsiales bacterium]HCX20926.1 hypothetical protein [Cytophagales bacterium]